MVVLTFLIALAALVIAILAYRRTQSPRALEAEMENLRNKTADALSRMERSLRKGEESKVVETSSL